MNIFAIIIIVALVGLVVWLGIDTVIYIVKKSKLKKQQKKDLDDSSKD